MHCPVCGQRQVSEHTRFCSRCGFLLTGVAELVANSGVVKTTNNGLTGAPDSRKRRGVKQGVFVFLLTFLIVPLLLVFAMVTHTKPVLALLGLILFGIGGAVRTLYAILFESGDAVSSNEPSPQLQTVVEQKVLPPTYSAPASTYAAPSGGWRDTNDLEKVPGSVTDSTTKLLQKEEQDQ